MAFVTCIYVGKGRLSEFQVAKSPVTWKQCRDRLAVGDPLVHLMIVTLELGERE